MSYRRSRIARTNHMTPAIKATVTTAMGKTRGSPIRTSRAGAMHEGMRPAAGGYAGSPTDPPARCAHRPGSSGTNDDEAFMTLILTNTWRSALLSARPGLRHGPPSVRLVATVGQVWRDGYRRPPGEAEAK